MADKSLAAWKSYLRGRIAQEQGQDDQALRAFEQALLIDPNNVSFLNSKSIALQRLNRRDDAVAAQIEKSYRALASELGGDNDKPEAWIAGLNSVLEELQDLENAPVAGLVVW